MTDEKATIQFALTDPARVVLSITHEGKLVMGEGFSPDEMSRQVFDTLAKNFPNFVGGIVKQLADEKAKSARLEDELAFVTAPQVRDDWRTEYKSECKAFYVYGPDGYQAGGLSASNAIINEEILRRRCTGLTQALAIANRSADDQMQQKREALRLLNVQTELRSQLEEKLAGTSEENKTDVCGNCKHWVRVSDKSGRCYEEKDALALTNADNTCVKFKAKK